MQTRQLKTTEGAIWGRVIRPAQDGLTAEAAQAFLGLTFDQADRQRMHELAEKAREGTLTPEEKQEVAAYERVGSVLSLLKAKARRLREMMKDFGGPPPGQEKTPAVT